MSLKRPQPSWRVVTPNGTIRTVRVEFHDVPQCREEPLYVEVRRDMWELVGGKETDDDVRRAIGRHIAAREILAPGELTAAERIAERVAEAVSASAEGYRNGVRHRVLDALAGVRDAAQAIVKTDGDWDDSNCGGQCVAVIEEAMAAVITSGR